MWGSQHCLEPCVQLFLYHSKKMVKVIQREGDHSGKDGLALRKDISLYSTEGITSNSQLRENGSQSNRDQGCSGLVVMIDQ